MNIEALEKMPKSELVTLAREAGIPVDGRSSQQAIIAALAAKITDVASPVQKTEAKQEPKVNRVFFSTREEIEESCPKNVSIKWHDDESFTASYNGMEECMTQHQSINVIKRRFRDIARGPLKLQMTKEGTLKEGNFWQNVSA